MATNPAQDRIDAVAARRQDPRHLLRVSLEKPDLLQYIKSVAPGLDPLGVVRVAYAHVQATPALTNCTVASIVRAVAEAAKLSLTVDGVLGHAYLVPYGKEAKMLLGYRGIMHLAYQSRAVTRFHADTIHAGDDYEYVEGIEPVFHHAKPLAGRGEIVGAYAMAHLAAGGPPLIAVMGLEEIHARRERSASYKRSPEKSPWGTDYLAMCRKTPVRELGKVIPYPVLQGAALRDEARDEGRAVPEGDPVAATWTEEKCPKCDSLHLGADGRCFDCDPREPGEEGA